MALALPVKAQDPRIFDTKSPGDTNVSLNATVIFRVSAVSTNPPLTFQWQHEGTNLPAATNSTLIISNVTATHAGGYRATVWNASNDATNSRTATLRVDRTFTKLTTGPVVTDVGPGPWESPNWWDYENDGYLDLFIPQIDGPQGAKAALYHNNRGTFTRTTNAITAQTRLAWLGAVGDIDNDGHHDLLIARFTGADDLFRNEGGGIFTRQTGNAAGAPVTDADDTTSAGWADYDRDGFIDLFAANSMYASPNPNRNDCLYRNNGDGSFTRMSTNQVGMLVGDRAATGPCAWADYDNDGWPDLWVGSANADTSLAGRHYLWRNNGNGTFSRVSAGSLDLNLAKGVGSWGDYDNDGHLDLFLTSWSATDSLHRNLGDGSFSDVSAAAGLGKTAKTWGAAWGDYDNDGFLDMFVAAYDPPSVLYRNNGDGTFASVDVGSPLHDARNAVGVAWADYDNDGFLDLLITREAVAQNLLYHNNGNSNAWIKVKLTGTASNRSAIGAKVRVQATIRGRTIWQMREITGNSGMDGGSGGLVAHFGLGDATIVDLVRIEWPSGNVQEVAGVIPRRMLSLTEPGRITPARPTASQGGSITLAHLGAASAWQWFHNGTSLAGQTTRYLKLTDLVAANAGRYSVVVTLSDGTLQTNFTYLHVDTTFSKITSEPWSTDLGTSSVAVGDYDEDGFLDVFLGRYGSGRSAIYHNNQDGTFSSLSDGTFPLPVGWHWFGPCSDFDNDGHLDFFAYNGSAIAPDLFYGNGDGTFVKVAFEKVDPWWTMPIDFDHDGLLDLYFTGWGAGQTNRLYKNLGDRRYQLMTRAEAGDILGLRTSFGGAWADYDDDGWEDVVLARGGGAHGCLMFRNTGAGRFLKVTNEVTQATIQDAIVPSWGDYNNDGRVDLYVAGTQNVLFRNLGSGHFERITNGVNVQGFHNGASWGDYDNDGWLDLFTTGGASTNSVLRNNGNGTFTRVGLGSIGTDLVTGSSLMGSYAGLWFDYDNDGFLDLLVPNGNDEGTAKVPNFLYRNNGNSNSWLKVKLVGTTSNPEGVGAKVRVRAPLDGILLLRWQRRDVTSGGDPYNGMGPIAHFGLGTAKVANTLRIEWPSGTVQELYNVAANQFLTVFEPRRPVLAVVVTPTQVTGTLTGDTNQIYQIQASDDLGSGWTNLSTITTDANGQGTWTDAVVPPQGSRFYKAMMAR